MQRPYAYKGIDRNRRSGQRRLLFTQERGGILSAPSPLARGTFSRKSRSSRRRQYPSHVMTAFGKTRCGR